MHQIPKRPGEQEAPDMSRKVKGHQDRDIALSVAIRESVVRNITGKHAQVDREMAHLIYDNCYLVDEDTGEHLTDDLPIGIRNSTIIPHLIATNRQTKIFQYIGSMHTAILEGIAHFKTEHSKYLGTQI